MKLKKKVTCCVVSIGIISGLCFLKHNYLPKKTRLVTLDLSPFFSKTFHNEMNLFLQKYQTSKINDNRFVADFKKVFSVVDRVTVCKKYNHKTKVQVVPHEPLARVNESHIMTRNGLLVQAGVFAETVQKSLPEITIAQNNQEKIQITSACLRFVNRFIKRFYSDFSVTWFDKTKIELKDKKDTQFSLLAFNETEFEEPIFESYNRLKQEVLGRNSSKKNRWCVDMRFKNQVLLFAQKGERG
jgi:hypothetical protein